MFIQDLPIIKVAVPASWGWYEVQLVTNGHIPGVLSGAALTPSQRRCLDHGRYHRIVEEYLLSRYGISSHDCRRAGLPKVWLRNGQRVRLVVV